MPLATESLTKNTPLDKVNDAINKAISQCMDEPLPEGMTREKRQKQCVAIAYETARKATGRRLSRRGE